MDKMQLAIETQEVDRRLKSLEDAIQELYGVPKETMVAWADLALGLLLLEMTYEDDKPADLLKLWREFKEEN